MIHKISNINRRVSINMLVSINRLGSIKSRVVNEIVNFTLQRLAVLLCWTV